MKALDDYLPYLLNRAGARIADAFGKVTRQHGISLQMWRVLAALHHRVVSAHSADCLSESGHHAAKQAVCRLSADLRSRELLGVIGNHGALPVPPVLPCQVGR